jgi:hypothetical protein
MKHISLPLENVMKAILQQTLQNYGLNISVVCFVNNYNSAIIKTADDKLVYIDPAICGIGQLIEDLQKQNYSTYRWLI